MSNAPFHKVHVHYGEDDGGEAVACGLLKRFCSWDADPNAVTHGECRKSSAFKRASSSPTATTAEEASP